MIGIYLNKTFVTQYTHVAVGGESYHQSFPTPATYYAGTFSLKNENHMPPLRVHSSKSTPMRHLGDDYCFFIMYLKGTEFEVGCDKVVFGVHKGRDL